MSIQGQIADAFVAAIVAGKDKITAFLGTAEATGSVAVKEAVNNFPKPGGLVGLVLPAIESEIDAEIDSLVNKFGPDELYALVLEAAQSEAKALGG